MRVPAGDLIDMQIHRVITSCWAKEMPTLTSVCSSFCLIKGFFCNPYHIVWKGWLTKHALLAEETDCWSSYLRQRTLQRNHSTHLYTGVNDWNKHHCGQDQETGQVKTQHKCRAEIKEIFFLNSHHIEKLPLCSAEHDISTSCDTPHGLSS